MATKYSYWVGRRKTATAQVQVFEWTSDNMINGQKASVYITRSDLFEWIFWPIKVAKLKDKVYFVAKVVGSWVSAQAQAITNAIAKAIADTPTMKKVLRSAWYITTDSRNVERKKPGHHKSRKSHQWSKR